LAGVLTRLKRHSKAVEHYKAALEKRQDDPGLNFQLGMAYIELSKMEEAIPALDASIQLRPSLLAHYNLRTHFLS
jgi:tetratricopeptide (TPR) repeat protein